MNFKSICVGLCTAGFLFLSVQAGLFIRDLRIQTLPQITLVVRHLDESAKDLDKSAQSLNVLIENTAVVVDNVNDTATQEQKFLVVESRDFLKTTTALKQFVQGLDINLNRPETGVLPKLSADLDQQNAALLALQAQSTQVIAGLVPVEKNINDTTLSLADATKQTAPEIVATTKALHATADDGKEVADVYKQKLLHPFRSVWHDFTSGLSVAVSALEIHAFWP